MNNKNVFLVLDVKNKKKFFQTKYLFSFNKITAMKINRKNDIF